MDKMKFDGVIFIYSSLGLGLLPHDNRMAETWLQQHSAGIACIESVS